jgi:hypothetical protein
MRKTQLKLALPSQVETFYLVEDFNPLRDKLLYTSVGVFELSTLEEGGSPIMIDRILYFVKKPE